MVIIPTITTVEIKCGAYSTVCVTRLNPPLSSLTTSATRIGTGNPTNSVYRDRAKVLQIRFQK